MQPGTAKITLETKGALPLFVVRYMNIGNFLQNQPRYFETVQDAEKWCRENSLKVKSYQDLIRQPKEGDSVEGDLTGSV